MPLEVVPGLDIGGTFTNIGLVDHTGSIHYEYDNHYPRLRYRRRVYSCLSHTCYAESGKGKLLTISLDPSRHHDPSLNEP